MGQSDNERAEKTQLEAMMKEHKGDLAPAVPRARGVKSPKKEAAPRSNVAVQKQGRAKSDSYEIMLRRRKVQSLRLRQFSYPEIAEKLDVPEHTVRQDIEFLRKQSEDAVDHFKQTLQQGDALARFDEIEIKLWEEYEGAVDEDGNPVTTARIKCLDMIRVVQNDRLRAMQDCGLLTKVAEKVEHQMAYQLPWTPQLKAAAAQAMLASALTPMLPAPEPDIIDVELVPPEAEVAQAQAKLQQDK